MHMTVLLAYIHKSHLYAWCPWKPEEGNGSSESVVKDN